MERMKPEEANRILDFMEGVEGYFNREEGYLLLETALEAAESFPGAAIVEVGSYCGKSTVALGAATKAIGKNSKVYAIDPHEGELTGLGRQPSSLLKFTDTIRRSNLEHEVELVRKRSYEVALGRPIGFLFIDGLHGYQDVRRDYLHFSPLILKSGYVAFHDYAGCFPGVMKFVDELVGSNQLIKERFAVSLIVLRKR